MSLTIQIMKILLLGAGGREHALAWKMSQSSLCSELFVAPGNAGTTQVAVNVPINPTAFEDIKGFVLDHQINMVVVGPEDPLVAGIVDFFESTPQISHIPVIGPSKAGAQLEGSKDFAKQFMMRHNIPTAAYQTFTKDTVEQGYLFLEALKPPFVLKADGLAAGKGVLIIQNLDEAKAALRSMLLHEQFGQASAKVVIEEFLSGIELSCFVLTDGKSYKILPAAKDYKRIGEGDTGLNTGGMGAVSPVPFVTNDLLSKIEEQIVKPTIRGLAEEKINYRGFIFIGLINVDGTPKVIEYNVRMGDPETEVVIPRIKSDLIALFNAVAGEHLDTFSLEVVSESAATVMMVSGGYPENYQKGKPIKGLQQVQDAFVFHAGTAKTSDGVVTNGGRVLAVTAFGDNIQEAIKKSYRSIEKISFDKMYFRKDIGNDLL